MKNKTTEKKDFTLPSYREIPDVGLYLDQCTKYINSYLIDFPEMNVTASMISNYAKQQLIRRISRKTYSRSPIAVLILINLIKNIISIDNIRLLLETMLTDEETPEGIYEYFRHALMISYGVLFGEKAQKNDVTIPQQQQEILARIADGVAYKMYLEQYFDTLKQNNE